MPGTSLFGCMRLPGISWTIEKFKSNGNTRPSPVDRRKWRLYLRRISSSGNVRFFPVGELLKGIIGPCILNTRCNLNDLYEILCLVISVVWFSERFCFVQFGC